MYDYYCDIPYMVCLLIGVEKLGPNPKPAGWGYAVSLSFFHLPSQTRGLTDLSRFDFASSVIIIIEIKINMILQRDRRAEPSTLLRPSQRACHATAVSTSAGKSRWLIGDLDLVRRCSARFTCPITVSSLHHCTPVANAHWCRKQWKEQWQQGQLHEAQNGEVANTHQSSTIEILG